MLRLIVVPISMGLVITFWLGWILGVENFKPDVIYKTEYKTVSETVLIPQLHSIGSRN